MNSAQKKYIEYVYNRILKEDLKPYLLVRKGTNRFVKNDYYTNELFGTTYNDIRAFFGNNMNGSATERKISKKYALDDEVMIKQLMKDLENYCIGEHEVMKLRVRSILIEKLDRRSIVYDIKQNTIDKYTIGHVRKMVNNIEFGQTEHEKLVMLDEVLTQLKIELRKERWQGYQPH
jgi:hypothetical protein